MVEQEEYKLIQCKIISSSSDEHSVASNRSSSSKPASQIQLNRYKSTSRSHSTSSDQDPTRISPITSFRKQKISPKADKAKIKVIDEYAELKEMGDPKVILSGLGRVSLETSEKKRFGKKSSEDANKISTQRKRKRSEEDEGRDDKVARVALEYGIKDGEWSKMTMDLKHINDDDTYLIEKVSFI
jgi:hypothetical protein